MNITPAARHLDDDDIVRLHDHECAEAEEHAFHQHLVACEDCQVRVDRFVEDSAAVSAWLDAAVAETPATVPPRRRRYGRVITVLGAAGVVGGALAADPIRTWFVDLVGASGPAPATTAAAPGPETTPPPAPAPTPATSMRIGYQWTGGSVALSIANAQAGGSLDIEWQDGPRVDAVVLNGGSESITVVPSGLRILNRADSESDYLLTVPAGLDAVIVSIGTGDPQPVTRPGTNRASIPLGN